MLTRAVSVSIIVTFLEGIAISRGEVVCIRSPLRVVISLVEGRGLASSNGGLAGERVIDLGFKRTLTEGQVTVTVFGITRKGWDLQVFRCTLDREVERKIDGVTFKSRLKTGTERAT